jgi:hypothetical protein
MSGEAPYKTGAPVYQAAGWTGVIPLPPKKKSAPPSGYTGWNGKDPSSKMIDMWCGETTGDYQAASNIAIHMPDGAIGIDVDHYDGKTGGDTLKQLEADLGPLPATYISTSRVDSVSDICYASGIRWYRVEPGLRWPTGPGKDIEFIHTGHRYAVVWPSVHDKTGNQYVWLDHRTSRAEPPEADQLAELPWEWVARFTGGEVRPEPGEPPRQATEEELGECLTEGTACQAVGKALAKYQDRLAVNARHDSALKTAMALVRLGEQGHAGVKLTIEALRTMFVSAVAKDRIDGSEGPEFDRFIDGAVVKVLADPTAPEDKRCCGSSANKDDVRALTKNLPEDFWCSRSVLGHIRQAAHSRGRSADVVLYTTLARISAMVSPLLRFENCLGEGSLNLFVAPIGRSGRGKSAAVKIAKTLIRTPFSLSSPELFRDSLGIGSGEGLAELYMGWEYVDDYSRAPKKDGTYYKKRVKSKLRDNAFVYVDEGQTLNQQGKRQGNIVLPTIRSAFNGETLGQANASEETTRHVPAGSYSLGMVIGYQKDTVQDLLLDVTPGTPQRFIMCSATDRSVPLEPPEHPGYLDVDLEGGIIPRTGKITLSREINEELWQQNHAKVTGAEEDDAELDSHEPLMLSKLAALLCLIDGRSMVTLGDWALAKIMYATSRAVMDDLVEYGQQKSQDRADAYADAHAIREARGYLAKKNADSNVARIGKWIYTYTADHGGVVTIGDAKRNAASRDRGLLHDGLDYAVSLRWLTTDGKKIAIGLEAPS